MGTITFTATSDSPSLTESVGVNIADADLATVISYATSLSQIPDATPTQSLQWIAGAVLTNLLSQVQQWQYNQSKNAVIMPDLISTTPIS